MGTWGILAFDNDTALDWAYGLESHKDLKLVEAALERVASDDEEDDDDDDEYLELDAACEALAACEVLARLRGRHGYKNTHTEDVDDWVALHPMVPPPQLLERAHVAIERILGKSSELADVWAESPESKAWRKAVADLQERVRG
jgi:Domain of unknown function (DUF4259)